MTATAIRVQGLSKRYTIGSTTEPYGSLRDSLTRAATMPLQQARRLLATRQTGKPNGAPDNTLWALRDLTFDVKQGEAIGIVGHNGAGKSTLLKVLSRITEPTTGRVELYGRVGSLLEVGTGFHPELTGRENVFLNGSILGMSRADIARRFDEIVAFAEVERFVDTPMKRYSSGMYLRLAFAVAAHLEPDILVVDEVLAVGDLSFQKKCLGKMGTVAAEGRTLLFVSHNLGAVRQLCSTGLWLDGGQVRHLGSVLDVVNSYSKHQLDAHGTAESHFEKDLSKEFQLRSARLLNGDGVLAQNLTCDEPLTIELTCDVHQRVPGLYGYLHISRNDGNEVMVSDSFDQVPNPLDDLQVGSYLLRVVVPARSLGPGEYTVHLNFTSLTSSKGFNVDSPGQVLSFRLDDFTSRRGNQRRGYFSTLLSWDLSACEPTRG